MVRSIFTTKAAAIIIGLFILTCASHSLDSGNFLPKGSGSGIAHTAAHMRSLRGVVAARGHRWLQMRSTGKNKGEGSWGTENTIAMCLIAPVCLWALICAVMMFFTKGSANHMQAYFKSNNWWGAETEVCGATFLNYFCCLPLVTCRVVPVLPSTCPHYHYIEYEFLFCVVVPCLSNSAPVVQADATGVYCARCKA